MKRIIALFFIFSLPAAAAEQRSLYGSYGMVSQATLKHQSIDLALGTLFPWAEQLGFMVEYGYSKSADRGARWSSFTVRDDLIQYQSYIQEKTEYRLHQLFIGATKQLGLHTVVWGGVAYGYAQGDYILDSRFSNDERFRYHGDLLFTQSGIGNRWQISGKLQLGIDWLVFGSLIYERYQVKGKERFFDEQHRFARYQPEKEIANAIGQMISIKTLRCYLIYQLD